MYSEKDRADVPLKSLRVPDSIINASNLYSPHTLRIASVLGTTDIFIDNSAETIGRVELNPMGIGGDFIAFSLLSGSLFQGEEFDVRRSAQAVSEDETGSLGTQNNRFCKPFCFVSSCRCFFITVGRVL